MMIRTNVKRIRRLAGLTSILLIIATALTAQSSGTITGRVVDSLTARPLAGVSIAFGNPAQETTTDGDGNFTLQVAPNEQLSFRYVGYQTKRITVNRDTALNIMMSQVDETLDEVVVVGYGSQKRAHLTGSVKTVDATAMEEIPISNASRLLQGQSPGVWQNRRRVNRGRSSKFLCAGAVLSAQQVTLYNVVDGFPVGKCSSGRGTP